MKRVKASSLIELVIALSIISICLAVASRVFVQNSRSSIKFNEVKSQTEFQSLVFNAFRQDTLPVIEDWDELESTIKIEEPERSKKYRKVFYVELNDRKIWQQEFGSE